MACGSFLGRFPFTLQVASGQECYLRLTSPLLRTGGYELSYAMTLVRATGNVVAIPATETFVARDDLTFAVTAASGTWQSAQDTTLHTTNLTTVTDKFMTAGGVLAKLSGGTTEGYVEGFLSVVYRQCVQTIGRKQGQVEPWLTTADPLYLPLGRVPASGASKVCAALITNSIVDVDWALYGRGVNDPDKVTTPWTSLVAWSTLTNGYNNVCATDAVVSGLTPTSYHQLEFALGLRRKAAGGAPAGFWRAMAALGY